MINKIAEKHAWIEMQLTPEKESGYPYLVRHLPSVDPRLAIQGLQMEDTIKKSNKPAVYSIESS